MEEKEEVEEVKEETKEERKEEGTKLSAIVVGGSGAIGKNLVLQLLHSDDFSSVVSIGRRELPLEGSDKENKKLIQRVLTDMDKMEEVKSDFENKDVAFCCLGTTRKDAGSAEAFRKIDHDLVMKFANLAKDGNVNHFSLVSSSGANAKSPFLYPKVKGQVEDAIKSLGFSAFSIFRPGLLDRGAEARFVEKLAGAIMSKIKVEVVGKAMVRDAVRVKHEGLTGTHIFDNSKIRELEKDK